MFWEIQVYGLLWTVIKNIGIFGYEAKNRYIKTYILNVGQWRHFSDLLVFWPLNLSSTLHLLE